MKTDKPPHSQSFKNPTAPRSLSVYPSIYKHSNFDEIYGNWGNLTSKTSKRKLAVVFLMHCTQCKAKRIICLHLLILNGKLKKLCIVLMTWPLYNSARLLLMWRDCEWFSIIREQKKSESVKSANFISYRCTAIQLFKSGDMEIPFIFSPQKDNNVRVETPLGLKMLHYTAKKTSLQTSA